MKGAIEVSFFFGGGVAGHSGIPQAGSRPGMGALRKLCKKSMSPWPQRAPVVRARGVGGLGLRFSSAHMAVSKRSGGLG